MSWSRVRLTVVLVCSGMIAGAIACQDSLADFSGVRQAASAPEAPPLFDTTELPYEGRGTVSVLNDGLLVVGIGGGLLPQNEAKRCGTPYAAKESFALAVDPGRTMLAEVNRGWSLFPKTAPIRGEAIHFDEGFVPDEDHIRYSVLTVEGAMCLAHDAATGVYTLEVVDGEEAEAFFVRFWAVEVEDSAPGAATSRDGSSCEATCEHGDCSITCDAGKAALCYCDNGWPKCECIKKPKQVGVDPEDPG